MQLLRPALLNPSGVLDLDFEIGFEELKHVLVWKQITTWVIGLTLNCLLGIPIMMSVFFFPLLVSGSGLFDSVKLVVITFSQTYYEN